MNLFDRFMDVFDALAEEKVEYVLVGGFAVILHGLPRVTQDVDIFIKPDSENVQRLRSALERVFHDRSIDEITLEALIEYPVVRYGSPDGFYIDIITHLGDAFAFDDIMFDERLIDGHRVRIATAESLYDMKKDTVRPIDKADAQFLRSLSDKGK